MSFEPSLADETLGGDECNNDQDEDMEFLVQVIAPVLDLGIEIDDYIPPEVVDATFACAVAGLFEALLPSIFLTTKNVHDAPHVRFSKDQEPTPVPFDRHVAKRAPKKSKHKKYSLNGAAYGGPTSRAPSRAASRFGGSTRAPSLSMRSALFATKLAKLTRSILDASAPFQIMPWNDGAHTPLNALSMHTWDSNHGVSVSLAGNTSRRPVDAREGIRRGEIERDLTTREERRRLTQQIQRKAETPLKLRSLEDPTISLDSEEMSRISASRGHSRIGGSRVKTPAKTAQLSSLSKPISGFNVSSLSAVASSPALGGVAEGDADATYRSEDYRGISSDIVILGTAGEVLVGENCYLIGRKARGEISKDLSKKANVQPRIKIAAPLAPTISEVVVGNASTTENPRSPIVKAPLPAVSVRKSPSKPKLVENLDSQLIEPSPEFEGCLGSFNMYPRLELDPTKTPLAAGVALIGPDGKPTDTKPKVSPHPQLKHRHADIPVKLLPTEKKSTLDHSEKPEEPEDTSTHIDQPSVVLKPRNAEMSPTAPTRSARHSSVSSTKHLHSLRRTPAQERRPPPLKQSQNHFKLAELKDAELLEHDDVTNTMAESPSLPRVKYMREFPSPPSGTIRIFSAAKPDSLVEGAIGSPFKPLPSILKSKR